MNPSPPSGVEPGVIELFVTPANVSILPGQEIRLSATGRDRTGAESELTAKVAWASSDDAVVLATATPGSFTANVPGDVVVTATYGALSATANIEVTMTPRAPVAIHVSVAELTLEVGASASASAELEWDDGTRDDVTSIAAWRSSDAALVTVDRGNIARVAGGTATIEVEYLELVATIAVRDAAAPCAYPAGNTSITLNGLMPNVSWRGAYRADGTQLDFSLEDIHCGAEYADKTVIVFIVGAGWCQPCSDYTRELNTSAASIESSGALIIYVEAEDASYQPATTEYANTHINHLIENGPGIRVGDADTQPRASVFLNSPLTTQFPTAFVVRKSDMKLIVNQAQWNSMLPYSQIALHAEADWSNPNNPPQFENCAMGDEEASEPNDAVAQAAPIQAGTFAGGICDANADFYEITHAGSWRFDVAFSHAVGDIDVYVWNPQTNQPLTQNGDEVGSDSGDDDESFMHSGPAIVKVFGYRGATAPYQVTLTTF
jgi:hypothetical protein